MMAWRVSGKCLSPETGFRVSGLGFFFAEDAAAAKLYKMQLAETLRRSVKQALAKKRCTGLRVTTPIRPTATPLT